MAMLMCRSLVGNPYVVQEDTLFRLFPVSGGAGVAVAALCDQFHIKSNTVGEANAVSGGGIGQATFGILLTEMTRNAFCEFMRTEAACSGAFGFIITLIHRCFSLESVLMMTHDRFPSHIMKQH